MMVLLLAKPASVDSRLMLVSQMRRSLPTVLHPSFSRPTPRTPSWSWRSLSQFDPTSDVLFRLAGTLRRFHPVDEPLSQFLRCSPLSRSLTFVTAV